MGRSASRPAHSAPLGAPSFFLPPNRDAPPSPLHEHDVDSIVQPLGDMWKSGALTDCVLSVGAREFRVHAVVVAAASRHLHASLTGGMRESAGELGADGRRTYRLELDGGMGVLSANALERLIEFIYTHRMDIGDGRVSNDELLGGAELLELHWARSFITTHLVYHLSLDTWDEVLLLGYKYGILELKSAGIAWVKSRLGREITRAALRTLPLACVQDLLACEHLQGCGSEDEVLDVAMSWAFGVDGDAEDAADFNVRGDALAALLTRVRLPHLSPPKLEELRTHPLVRNNLACMRLLADLSSFTGKSHGGAEDGDIGQFWVQRKCFRPVPNSLVVFDGKQVFIFNAEGSRFKPLTSSPIELSCSACAVLPGGNVFCVEGPLWHQPADTRRAFCLNLGAANGKGAWKTLSTFPYRARNSAAAALNGYVYLAGGARDIDLTLSRVDRYCPASDAWETVASMISKRESFTLVPIGGFLYAVGGSSRPPERYNVSMVERYDPTTNTWAAVTTTDPLVIIDAAATMGGLLYVAGGRYAETTGFRDECFCFDPVTVSWRQIANLPEPRCSVALACLSGQLYAMGGFGEDDEAEPSQCPIWRYNPVRDVWEDVPLSEGSETLIIDDNCSWCAACAASS